MGKEADFSVVDSQYSRRFHHKQSYGKNQGTLQLVECNKRMLSNEIATDFTFKLNCPAYTAQWGDKYIEVKAHKYVLRSRSKKFEEIVSHHDFVTIHGVQEESLHNFLRYVYTDELALREPEVYQILTLAQDYQVYILIDECFQFLSNHIRDDNICLIYDLANNTNQRAVKGYCLRKLLADPEPFLTSRSFLDMSSESVKSILELDELCVDESLVYDSVVRWAEEKIQRHQPKTLPEEMPTHRDVLGDLLYAVRFPLLGSKFVSTRVLPDGFLSAGEISELFQLYLGNGCVGKVSRTFTLRARGCSVCAGPTSNVVFRFKEIQNHQDSKGWRCNSNLDDAIAVECRAQITVDGVGVYGPRTEKSGFYNGCVQVILKSRVIQEASIRCEIKKSLIPHKVTFRRPVQIGANQRFDIRLKMRGPDTYYGRTTYRRHNEDIVGSFHPSTAHSQEGADVPSTYESKQYQQDKYAMQLSKKTKSRPQKEEKNATVDETEVTVDGTKFTFSHSLFSQNGTSFDEGQIPEIYFSICGTDPE